MCFSQLQTWIESTMEVFDDSQKLEIACAHHFVGISGKSE